MCAHFKSSSFQQSLIDRTALLEKLNSIAKAKLALIIAPPGYGKTTLGIQFAQQTKLKVVWQSLEKTDQDMTNLVDHCIRALSDIFPELNLTKFPTNSSGDAFVTQLTDYLRDTATDFIYILDDVHHLLESPEAKTWLHAFIATMPSSCHVILIGRALPPLPVYGMVARGEVIVIPQEELSFKFQEVNELAGKIDSLIPDAQVQKIFSLMMGWPAGTWLALQPLTQPIAAILFDGKESAEGLFDALASELVQTQSPLLQSFLFSSSTLARMNPSLCQSALHLTDSLENLNEALKRNLFITQVPGGMVYHSLFRDYLQRHLRTHNWAEFVRLHLNAAQWFEAENRLEEAFEHFITAEHWDQAADIAERSAHIYVNQGKTETLLYWSTQLTGMNVQAPRLHHMCAMILGNRYEYDLANLEFAQGIQEYQAQSNKMGLVQITLLKATIENQRGNFQTAIDTAKPFSSDLTIPSNLRGYALAIVGTAELYLCRLNSATELLETALPLWRATGDLFAVGQLLMTLEVVYLRQGRFPDAAKCIQEVMAIRSEHSEMTGIVLALNNLGYQQYLLGQYQQALEILQEGLQIVNLTPNDRTKSHILWTLGDLQADRGSFKEAMNFYQKSLQLASNKEPFLWASVYLSLAKLKRWEGNLDSSYNFALDAQVVCEKHNLGWEKMLSDMAICAVKIEQGEVESARKILQPIIDYWCEHPAPQLIPAIGLGAYAALLSSDKPTAHQLLKLAITHSRYLANIQPLIAEIVRIPLLKTFVERYERKYEVLIKSIQKLEAAQVEMSQIQDFVEISQISLTYSLRISVLGQEMIERDGKIIFSSAWEAASARELFFYLLFGRPSSREKLGLILWPDSSPQQIRQKFHSTLHRVRDAIGTNTILFENDLYSINPDIDLWCDVREFKAAFKQAQISSPLLAHSEILWRRAVELFNGDFLSQFDSEWVIDYRESLNQMYIDALLALANCIRVRGDVREAISFLKRALELEPYREDIHRLLLNYYKLLGDRSIIVRHMRDLTQLFITDLGTTPSAETLILSKSLIS